MTTTLNQAQRATVGVALSVCVVITLAHNPFSGYVTESELVTTVDRPLQPCSDADKAEYQQFLSGFYDSEVGANRKKEAELFGGVEKTISRQVENCHLLKPGLQTDSAYQKELQTTVTAYPLSEWHTKKPLMSWFGSLIHALYSALSVVITAFIFARLVFAK